MLGKVIKQGVRFYLIANSCGMECEVKYEYLCYCTTQSARSGMPVSFYFPGIRDSSKRSAGRVDVDACVAR